MHSIYTGDKKRVNHWMQPTPLGFEGEEEENLKVILDTGFITESSSDLSSASVLARKRDDTVRLISDH